MNAKSIKVSLDSGWVITYHNQPNNLANPLGESDE